MQEIKLTDENQPEVLQKTLEVLKNGGVIIYPTETSYGMGCDFYNKEAVDKIYQIKQRDKSKPLPVLVSSLTQAGTLVDFSEDAERLALEFWPGPLTLVLPFRYCYLQQHCDDYLALRVSSHVFASNLVSSL
ncbi:L-threonylcarbamoyladenylate synthase [bacterium]|nr:L-threonylcarbamoyladenylate synthase [bacterium]